MATVLTGHFQKQGNHLLVTLEAIETATERLVWQTNLTGSTQDLIGMQEQLAKQVRQGLLPMLGAAGGFLETSTRPNNQEAYDLYLRSVALSHDAAPNREAIRIAGTRGGTGSQLRARHGKKSACVITTTPPIRMAERRCSSTRTRP